MTYIEGIIKSLKMLGGHAYLKDINAMFEKIYGRPTNPKWRDNIRSEIERHSPDSKSYKPNNKKLFYSVEGISKGHWGLVSDINRNVIELTQDDDEFSEGKILLKEHLIRERNRMVIKKAKEKFKNDHNGKLYCEICGFDFAERYGSLGDNFIEAHHIKPVSEMKSNETTNINDIIMVCSNCHSMIHRRKPWLKKSELMNLLKKS